jgi:hypothetical protein
MLDSARQASGSCEGLLGSRQKRQEEGKEGMPSICPWMVELIPVRKWGQMFANPGNRFGRRAHSGGRGNQGGGIPTWPDDRFEMVSTASTTEQMIGPVKHSMCGQVHDGLAC